MKAIGSPLRTPHIGCDKIRAIFRWLRRVEGAKVPEEIAPSGGFSGDTGKS